MLAFGNDRLPVAVKVAATMKPRVQQLSPAGRAEFAGFLEAASSETRLKSLLSGGT
jgi:hypothetical protein